MLNSREQNPIASILGANWDMKKSICILGHKNPDVDSIISGYLLSSYMRYKGYCASYVIPDEIVDEETLSILSSVGMNIEFASRYNTHENDSLILLDHHETEQLGDVLAVIDHHPTDKVFDYPIYINKKASSTTKLIYDLLECDKEYISKRFIELVVTGILVDTCSFRSTKTNKDDIPWVKDMCDKFNLDFTKMCRIGDSLTDLSNIDKASIHGYKEFSYNNNIVKTSYIQTREVSQQVLDSILDNLCEKVENSDIAMWMFLHVDLGENTSVEYRIYKDKTEINEYDYVVSRGSTIMPKIEKIFM